MLESEVQTASYYIYGLVMLLTLGPTYESYYKIKLQPILMNHRLCCNLKPKRYQCFNKVPIQIEFDKTEYTARSCQHNLNSRLIICL